MYTFHQGERGDYSITSKTEIILDTLLHFFHKIYTQFREKYNKDYLFFAQISRETVLSKSTTQRRKHQYDTLYLLFCSVFMSD